MTVFEVAACLITLAAVLSYLNYTLLKLPPAIGLMALSLTGSLALVLVGLAVPAIEHRAKDLVTRIDLNQAFGRPSAGPRWGSRSAGSRTGCCGRWTITRSKCCCRWRWWPAGTRW